MKFLSFYRGNLFSIKTKMAIQTHTDPGTEVFEYPIKFPDECIYCGETANVTENYEFLKERTGKKLGYGAGGYGSGVYLRRHEKIIMNIPYCSEHHKKLRLSKIIYPGWWQSIIISLLVMFILSLTIFTSSAFAGTELITWAIIAVLWRVIAISSFKFVKDTWSGLGKPKHLGFKLVDVRAPEDIQANFEICFKILNDGMAEKIRELNGGSFVKSAFGETEEN